MKPIGVRSIIALSVVLLVLMSLTPIAIAIPGQLRLYADTGTYAEDDVEDAWLTESLVTSETSFNLTITNHNGGELCYLYLLVAVDREPEGNVTISVDGTNVSAYNGVITSNNKALVTDTEPDYEYPGHGIYSYGSTVHFAVINISLSPVGDVLAAGDTITVPIVITPSNDNYVKVHFDAVGADCSGEAIAFVPPSEDATYETPEFASIVIPVASLLGLLFFFNHRKRRREA